MLLAQLSAGFQSLPLLPISEVGPCGADSWVGGFMHVLGPCGSLQQPLLWGWEFLRCHLNPHRCFQSEALRLYVPLLRHWVARSVFSLVVPPGSPAGECGTAQSAICHLARSTSCHLAHPGPPTAALLHVLSALASHLLLVWMNVSSLTPWLLDFHTVQFSVGSGCLLFLNLLLSFFWLCEEAQCVYLCLHLGWAKFHLLKVFSSHYPAMTFWDPWHLTTSLAWDVIPIVRVVSDTGWERIHKEKKVQRVKFYSLSKKGEGHGVERYISTEHK